MLSKRVIGDSHGQNSSYFIGWQEYERNPYHEVDNPNGIVQMGLAENQLCHDIIESWITSNSDATGLRSNGQLIFRELALFQDYYGLSSLKDALVQYMAKVRGNRVTFDPKKLVLFAGATSASEALMFCLTDKGDAFLLPTPYYSGFDRDLKWRTDVEIVPVDSSSYNDFKITKSALENAYEQALELDLNVKGILVTNPSNPLGTTMTSPEISNIIKFAIDKNIHIVSDEIYSATAFDYPNFISIAEAVMERDLQHTGLWNRIHIVSSLSKDLGLPGFRVGMVYSNNELVVAAATKMSSFGLISSQTQYLLANMLSDKKIIGKYMTENTMRLKKRREMLVSGLLNAGIRCLKSNAGLFCLVDMRHLLRTQTFQAEKELWLTILRKVGLNISPGHSCHCVEPGWFRICFANMSEETLNVAMKRLKRFVDHS